MNRCPRPARAKSTGRGSREISRYPRSTGSSGSPGRPCVSRRRDPGAGDAAAGEEAGPISPGTLEHVLPGRCELAAAVRRREEQVDRRIERGDHEGFGRTGNRREDVSSGDGLEGGHDLAGTGHTPVVDPVPAVPATSASAHLCEPGPDVLGRSLDGDRMGQRQDCLRKPGITGQQPRPFRRARSDRRDRHLAEPRARFSPGFHTVEMLVVSGARAVARRWGRPSRGPCCPELVEQACSNLVSRTSGVAWGSRRTGCGESVSARRRLCAPVDNSIRSPQDPFQNRLGARGVEMLSPSLRDRLPLPLRSISLF